MRAVLYHLVMIAGSNVLKILSILNVIVAKNTYSLASFISPEQSKYYDALLPQAQDLSELKLIQESLRIRDAALEQDDWEPEHYQNLHYLMSSLYEYHGWKKKDIDEHMTMLVESGPEGYSYEPEPEDE
jgi:hypothetical protein